MLTRFISFLFVLRCSSSLLVPLPKQDGVTNSNPNNLVVSRLNQIKEISPNNSKVTKFIQQIDVKDDEYQVISNVSQVIISDEANETKPANIIQNDNNNGTNNSTVNKPPAPNGNSVLNKTGGTNSSNASSNGASNNSFKVENATVPGLQNKLANKTRSYVVIKEVSAVLNDSKSNASASSRSLRDNKIVPTTVGKKTVPSINQNSSSELKNSSISLKNRVTGVPIVDHKDGETSNDAKAEISWRSDIPMNRRNKAVLKDSPKTQNTSHENNKFKTLNTNNFQDVFLIVNSGNIDGLSINSPANVGNLQVKTDNNTIENLNPNNSKILSDLLNSTINNVLSHILKQKYSYLNSKDIFLILNSGNITNVSVNSPNLQNNEKNITLKDRSRRYLNHSKTNNTKEEAITAKPLSDKSNPIIDIKFRSGENQNPTFRPDATPTHDAISTRSNSKIVENSGQDKEISNEEGPVIRFLIPDKGKKLQQLSNVAIDEINKIKDNNLKLKKSPEPLPIFDLNQIPINNVLDGAFNFMKRFKRNNEVEAETKYPWKTNCITKPNDGHETESCKKTKSFIKDLTTNLRIPTRKSLDDNLSNVLKLYDSVELVCPLSVIVKLYARQILQKLAKNDSGDGIMNKIVSSFLNGNEDVVDLASKELFGLPVPVKLRLQIVHGKTNEFKEQLSSIVDSTLCSLA